LSVVCKFILFCGVPTLSSLLRQVSLLVNHIHQQRFTMVQISYHCNVSYQHRVLAYCRQVISTVNSLRDFCFVYLEGIFLLGLYYGRGNRLRILFHHQNTNFGSVEFLRVRVVLLVFMEYYFVSLLVIQLVYSDLLITIH